jgi:diacylglycerol O-acyltransferase
MAYNRNMKTEALTPIDTAWLHMEDPTNLMMVTGVLTLGGRVDFEMFKEVYGERLLKFDRFRQRVVESAVPLQAPHWAPDPHFDLDAHIHHIALPDPNSRPGLMKTIGDLASTPLDFSKPLWQVHLIDSFRGHSLVVMRFHHAIGDGTAMVRVTYHLMDEPPPLPGQHDADTHAQQTEEHGPGLLGTLLGPVRMALKATRKVADTVAHEIGESIEHPSHLLEIGDVLGRSASVIGHAMAMDPDAETPLKGSLGSQKHVDMSAPVPLVDVKKIGAATGTKVNDVLVTAMAGALRHYLVEEQLFDAEGLTIRAVIPVDLRHDYSLRLGNEFGVVFLELPLDIEDPRQRLDTVRQRMNRIKSSPEPYVFFGLLNTFGLTPKLMEEQIVNLFGSKATVVMTNVMGPKETLHFAGTPIDDITFWVPQSGRLGIGVSIMSYAGNVTLGVITDAGLVPDPGVITRQFAREFEQLAALAGD